MELIWEGRSCSCNLPVAGELDWEGLLRFFKPRSIRGIEYVEEGALRRTLRLGDDVGAISVRSIGVELELEVFGAAAMLGRAAEIAGLAARVLDLERDPAHLRGHFRGDAVLGPLARRFPGLRLPGAWDRFEMGVRAILGQQVSVAAAHTLAARLVDRYGTPFESPWHAVNRAFPLPDTVAAAGVNELMTLGLTRKRAETLGHFARWSMGETSLRGRLLDIPGIGPWTESYIQMRGESSPDAFPAADLGIQKALGLVGMSPLRAAKAAEQRSEEWRPWRAYAVIMLWRSLSEGRIE